MAKIYCKLCNSASGYTDATKIANRTRSFSIGSGEDAPKGDICFCADCWDDKDIGTQVTALRTK